MCFFLRNKKIKNKKSLQYDRIQVQLVNLLNENRAIHECLTKLHIDIQGQLMELRELSLNQTYSMNHSSAYSTIQRKKHSTLKRTYI